VRVRQASQAGRFYASNSGLLRKEIENCFTHRLGPGQLPEISKGPRNIVGLVCPHAGYVYSGPIAAHAYSSLATDGKPDIIVILGPNHTGQGSILALMEDGIWRTPLGDVQINRETAHQILRNSNIIDSDELAHRYEHSIEVQIPFLQFIYNSDFELVPISFSIQDLESCQEVGQSIANALEGKNALILTSTDLTHYEPHEIAERKDKKALATLKKLNEREFYSTIETNHITACGYGPVVALITASKLLGATKSQVLCYQTSGDVTGDYSSVVGYASVAVTK
jgi:AmmeMemoRadiSam system protein B